MQKKLPGVFQFSPWQNQTKIHRNVGWNHVNPHQNIAPEHSQKPPTPHQTLPATFARDALANTALTGKMLSHNKKNERFPAKIQDFSSQIKGGQSHHRSRKSLKDEILQKACKPVFKTKVANWRISPGASKSWSNFSEVKWQWQSTSAMALRGTQAPPSAKTHVLVDGSSCFGTAKLLFLNTGLVLLSSLWVDFSQYNSQLLGLYLQVSTLQFLLIRLS